MILRKSLIVQQFFSDEEYDKINIKPTFDKYRQYY